VTINFGQLELRFNAMSNIANGSVPVVLEGEDQSAYSANFKRHRKGISHKEMVQGYNEWADKYDVDLSPDRYKGPEIAASFLAQYYPEDKRETVSIIDIAAGTGRVGEELKPYGFKNVDGLEPADAMLGIAKERNIYGKYYVEAIGIERTSIEDAHYDCIVIAGGMGEGHIPTKALNEMIRIVKPGGLICIVMREEYLKDVTEYAGRLEPYMEELEAKGLWKRFSRTVVPKYSFNKNGVVFMYNVS